MSSIVPNIRVRAPAPDITDIGRFVCAICAKSYKQKGGYIQHWKVKHGPPYTPKKRNPSSVSMKKTISFSPKEAVPDAIHSSVPLVSNVIASVVPGQNSSVLSTQNPSVVLKVTACVVLHENSPVACNKSAPVLTTKIAPKMPKHIACLKLSDTLVPDVEMEVDSQVSAAHIEPELAEGWIKTGNIVDELVNDINDEDESETEIESMAAGVR
jgi:hypothetical protein